MYNSDHESHLLDEKYDRERGKRERMEECRRDAEYEKKPYPRRVGLMGVGK